MERPPCWLPNPCKLRGKILFQVVVAKLNGLLMPVRRWLSPDLYGHPPLDANTTVQSGHFFTLADSFLGDLGQDELRTCAASIYHSTREKFCHDEQQLRQLNDPDLQPHVDWHLRMGSRLNALSLSILSDNVKRQDLIDLTEDWALNRNSRQDALLSARLAGGANARDGLLASPGA
jgi:hypothetical protein